MKAIGYQKAGSDNVLTDIELPLPVATGHDLLVEIKAVAVNPVDCKIRERSQPAFNEYKVLGWDATAVVKSVGDQVSLFKIGDEIWYAGDLTRPGCNSEYHLVDERLVAKKPKTISFEEAAALPLTSLTAWELLFDRLKIDVKEQSTLLITGAAGGVGSILVQLAKQLTSLTVIGTASRQESVSWLLEKGAHYVIDHNYSLHEQLQSLNLTQVDYIISLTQTDLHAEELIKCIKPQGRFALIDDPLRLDIKLFKPKSVSIHWEFMFTRSMYKTIDMIGQHEILNQVAELVDQGVIRSTLNEHFGTINAENMRQAHQIIESGRSRGKIVLSGF